VTESLAELRAKITASYSDAATRAHLDSLTEEQFINFCRIMVDEADGKLRRITLDDGTGVLVDGDCTATDEEVRGWFSGGGE
jgi:hypothetical protein